VTERARCETVIWDEDYTGDVVVEAFTHLPARGGDEGEDDYLLAACRIGAGAARGHHRRSDLLRVMQHEEIAGARARAPGGVLELS
jgi:hypothetical protein